MKSKFSFLLILLSLSLLVVKSAKLKSSKDQPQQSQQKQKESEPIKTEAEIKKEIKSETQTMEERINDFAKKFDQALKKQNVEVSPLFLERFKLRMRSGVRDLNRPSRFRPDLLDGVDYYIDRKDNNYNTTKEGLFRTIALNVKDDINNDIGKKLTDESVESLEENIKKTLNDLILNEKD